MLKKIFSPLALVAYIAFIIILLMLVMPNETLTASLRGIAIWWEVLFPALFPFFVIAELMLGFGVVHFFGKILDPLMRPIFKIPGIGGFVVTLGYISGYPIGARLTAQLYEQKLLTRVEGERLVSFTTTSDPIFLIGAVSIGFFGQAELALIIAVAHYTGALIIGLLMRFHASNEVSDYEVQQLKELRVSSFYKKSLLHQALKAMHEARLIDGRPLAVILQQAIQSALKMMIVVGGLVVFFSVALQLLTDAKVLSLLIIALQHVFLLLGISPAVAEAIIPGIFEVTLGAQQASLMPSSLVHQAAIAVWVLSWAGLSVHAQVASLLSETSIRYWPFLLARFFHALISAGLLYLLWGWLAPV